MRRYSFITAIALLCVSLSASAKSSTLRIFIGKVASSSVSFDYTYAATVNSSKMTGSGNVTVQGNSFFMDGDGLEVWCDGKTLWTVDRAAEEAVIENVEDSADASATNPALLIASLDENFSEVSFGSSKFKGKVCDVSILSPVDKTEAALGIVQLKLYFKSGTAVLIGAAMKLSDGTATEFSISNLRFDEPAKEEESFRFNEKTLDSSYIVTDLR